MTKIIILIFTLSFPLIPWSQESESQKIISLAINYHNSMLRIEPTKDDIASLTSGISQNLIQTTDFVKEAITTKNKLLTPAFLTRPDDVVLKQVYIVREIDFNMHAEIPIDNTHLYDSLSKQEVPVYEMVDAYYGMLFTSVGNKNQPFNLSKTDLRLSEYQLRDDTEKAILALRAITMCNTNIWGFINIPKPPNTKKALDLIKKFPKINGQPYYQFQNLIFPNFELVIVTNKGKESYRDHYINKFYEALLSHLICLNNEGAKEDKKNDLLLGSILKERRYYKHTIYRETLEQLFQKP